MSNEVSLRDYFAGMALQGLLAGMDSKGVLLDKSVISHLAYSAFQFADEMVKQANPPGGVVQPNVRMG
ncbi:MAG TPA: hypothetical protein VM529_25650 [Gemmata sp.]|nr:hypothetical protein [Gemmata sp.]